MIFRKTNKKIFIGDFLYDNEGDVDALLENLNKNYKGWVLDIIDEDRYECFLFHVIEYKISYDSVFMEYDKYTQIPIPKEIAFNAQIQEPLEKYIEGLNETDVIIKIEIVDETNHPKPKIRWYSKGNFSDWKE